MALGNAPHFAELAAADELEVRRLSMAAPRRSSTRSSFADTGMPQGKSSVTQIFLWRLPLGERIVDPAES